MKKLTIEQIEGLTCFNLSYCCGLAKKCPTRDFVLRTLEITPEEYEKIKEKCHAEFIALAKSKGE